MGLAPVVRRRAPECYAHGAFASGVAEAMGLPPDAVRPTQPGQLR